MFLNTKAGMINVNNIVRIYPAKLPSGRKVSEIVYVEAGERRVTYAFNDTVKCMLSECRSWGEFDFGEPQR